MYLRVKRDGQWQNLPIELMTKEEIEAAMAGRSQAELIRWIVQMADALGGLETVDFMPPATPAPPGPEAALALAMQFHETYERLAPDFGYETRTETKAFDPDSPNGRLMVAVCSEILAAVVR